MDLSKVSNVEQLKLCRTYFLGGFALLPFLWAINGVWFFNKAFCSPPFEEQKRIKTYVVLSIVGFFVWLTIVLCWSIIYHSYREEWGAMGDYLSFVIPLG